MKNEYKTWRNASWFLWSFKNQDTTIIWNDNTKTYEFVKGTMSNKVKPKISKPIQPTIQPTMKYYYWSIILSGLTGVLLAILLYILMFQ